MKVRSQLALIVALVSVSGCEAQPLRPNVILVSLDTLRADHLPFHGYSRDTAPALTAFAESGAIFDSAYSRAPSTTPTHASIFTGRLPVQHGTYTQWNSLAEEELTLAEHLKAHGYRTFIYFQF